MTLEISTDDKGNFDELIAKGATVHFEMLDDNVLWVGIQADGKDYAMFITSKGKLTVKVDEE